MTIRHRRYSTEFKIQVVQEYLDGEGGIRAVGVRHGVGHSLVRIWAEKYQRGELDQQVQLKEQIDEYEARIAALERKVGQLTVELDIAKKRHHSFDR
jgi:transposase